MWEGTWPTASETGRQCGRSLVCAGLLTLLTFGVAVFTAHGFGDPGFINLTTALQSRFFSEEADPDFRYEGFSGLNDSEQAASADKESANEDAALPTTQFVSTAPTLAPAPVANAVRPGRAKLIFVNCAEDAKIVRKGGQFKVLPCPHQCNMTVDKSDLSRADAVAGLLLRNLS